MQKQGDQEAKRTNEIKIIIPLLDSISIEGKVITVDALLTQRDLASYLVLKRNAHYHFTVKGNQPTLLSDIEFFFSHRKDPDFVDQAPPDHGRIEIRKIWVTTALNDYLNFPHVAQAFVIERHCVDKKPVNLPLKRPMGSPVNRPMKLARKLFLTPTEVTGALRTAATTSSIGTSMRIEAASALALVRKT